MVHNLSAIKSFKGQSSGFLVIIINKTIALALSRLKKERKKKKREEGRDEKGEGKEEKGKGNDI